MLVATEKIMQDECHRKQGFQEEFELAFQEQLELDDEFEHAVFINRPLDELDELLKEGANIHRPGSRVLNHAVWECNVGKLNFLLERGATLSTCDGGGAGLLVELIRGRRPKDDRMQVMRILVDVCNLDPASCYEQAWDVGLSMRDAEGLELLLAYGADINANHGAAMTLAIENSAAPEVFALCIQHRAVVCMPHKEAVEKLRLQNRHSCLACLLENEILILDDEEEEDKEK